jgi:hypothetical protein
VDTLHGCGHSLSKVLHALFVGSSVIQMRVFCAVTLFNRSEVILNSAALLLFLSIAKNNPPALGIPLTVTCLTALSHISVDSNTILCNPLWNPWQH